MIVDKDRELGAVVSYLVGRQVRTGEIINAMGVSRSGYYTAREAGRAITADQLLNIAKVFDLNPIDLMVRFGTLSADTAVAYVETQRNTSPG
jgi:hypothetical protein